LVAVVLLKNKLNFVLICHILKRVNSLNILLLVPETNALEIVIPILFGALNKEFIIELIQAVLQFFIVRLLQNEHSAGQDGQQRIFHILTHHLQGRCQVVS
jgi:hypothetical protein